MTNMTENQRGKIRYKWENVREMSFEELPTIPNVRNNRQVKVNNNFANQAIRQIKWRWKDR